VIGKQQYTALSEFRFRLAQFLHFSESAARAAGITPAQYLLLLHVRGFAGRAWATVGELAERLQASHQGTVALVQRCERNGLVSKRRNRSDARCVEIHLTPRARGLVQRIAKSHAEALAQMDPVFRAASAAGANVGSHAPRRNASKTGR
jgi:DNA-binding MarR family transcriptional regulator